MHLATQVWKIFNLPSSKRISLDVQISLLLRLANLLGRGYTLTYALDILQFDSRHKELARRIKENLLEGHPLDKILQTLNFSRHVVSFLFFSKQYGSLERALRQSSNILSKQQTFQRKFLKVIRYPCMLFILFFALLMFVKTFLLPSFLELYVSMNIHSSTLTHLIQWLNISLYMLLSIIVTLIVFFLSWRIWKKKISIITIIKFAELIPLIRSFTRNHTTFLFSYHFASLLQTGITIKDSLIIVSKQSHYPFLQHYAIRMYTSLEKGQSFSQAVQTCTLLHHDLVSLIQHNETDGRLEQDLEVYAHWMLEEMEQTTYKWLTFIQPTLFTLLALFIMAIYVSIMMPLFEWMQNM